MACILLGLSAPLARSAEPRPNVVFVLVDDMGYADVGCYGAKDIRTPNVDRLAREGVRMTDFYSNAPVCSPTRCGFITGRWQQRAGLEWALGVTSQCFVRDSQGRTLRPDPNFKQYGLPARAGAPTLARLLADSGYATACIGKWHLGWTPECSPNAHGFGTAFGIYGGNADLYSHKGRDGTDDLYENGKPVHEEGYLTELLTRRAERFIAENRDRPFFLYVPYNAVHWPFQPPGRPDLVRSYATWYEGDRRGLRADGRGHRLGRGSDPWRSRAGRVARQDVVHLQQRQRRRGPADLEPAAVPPQGDRVGGGNPRPLHPPLAGAPPRRRGVAIRSGSPWT